jgi:hypothetical protein
MARIGVSFVKKSIAGRKGLAIPIRDRADLSAYDIAPIGDGLRGGPARRLRLHSLLIAVDVHPLEALSEMRLGVRNGLAADRADASGHLE